MPGWIVIRDVHYRRASVGNNLGEALNERISELLVGLSVDELEALADGLLAPAAQARLSDLPARKRERQLAAGEETELDRLLRQVDHLTLLKTGARYIRLRRKRPRHERLHLGVSKQFREGLEDAEW